MNIYINERAFSEIQNGTKKIEGRLAVKRFLDLEKDSIIYFSFQNQKIKCCFQQYTKI
jgi:ASC-1-like (ASCH) protein